MWHSFANNMPDKTSRLHSIPLAKTTQEEANLLISKEPRFSTNRNEINSQHHRDVNLQTTETFLAQLGHNRNRAENDYSGHHAKHKTENIKTTSIKRGLHELTKCVEYYATTAVMPLYENGFNGFDWKPTLENTVITLGSMLSPLFRRACFFKKTGIFGIILNSLSGTAAKPVSNVIDIDNADTLQMIGKHTNFPSNGNYRLTNNIDARNITKPIPEFFGTLDGQEHVILHLQCCLIQKLAGDAVIKNLFISDANTIDAYCSATIAGTLMNNATLNFIHVRNSQIQTTRDTHYLGIVVEIMSGSSRIENTIVSTSTLISEHSASICGGLSGIMMDSAESKNNTITRCNLTTHGHSSSLGGLIGLSMGNTVSYKDSVIQSNATTSGHNAHSALGVGRVHHALKMKEDTFTDSSVTTGGIKADTGLAIGSGFLNVRFINIINTEILRCHALATGEGSTANIWIGMHNNNVHVYNSTAINCTSADKQPVTQSTITDPVTQSTITDPITQSTITDPVTMDDASLVVPILLYGGSTLLAITTVGLVSYSIYSGYQQGKTGWNLAKHPGQSCLKWFTDLYQSFSSTICPVRLDEEMEEGNIETENHEMTLLSNMSKNDNSVASEEHQLL
ncbi:MAG: hypothetical protein KAG53_11285 [Endozoicomonadaceae bacterium]|nr:hypothetical protein [Endozoicomonadaceae bacterium]